jgi:hypothetical protein
MPEAAQKGIRRAWERAKAAEMENASPERRAALEALDKASGGDIAALAHLKVAYSEGHIAPADYQLANPSEFWAVNASRILHERFTGRGSWRAQARQWMNEMVEHVKGIVGVRSDSAVLKALDDVLNPEKTSGEQRMTGMLKNPESKPLPLPPAAGP